MGQARNEVPEPLRRLGVTRREATVLAEVADRRRNPEIAERLVISVRTVESHLASLLRKLAVDDRPSLMVRARELLAVAAPRLPTPATPFVERHHELEDVGRVLAEHRLVTLVGPGGAGKTHLALRLAQQAQPSDGATTGFADLSGAAADDVGSVLADALGLRDQARTPGRTWHEAVRDVHGLLVVDNCEHVIEVAARHVAGLQRAAKGLTILATSREALRIPGEQVVAVTTMAEAEELFELRARAADPAFRRTAANAESIAELCRALDRMPLAIELAAARVATFDVDELLANLEHRFSLLVDGPRSADARQRTLEATLDWSHDLLDEHERLLLHRLAVFPSSFTSEAAMAACVDDELAGPDVLMALPRLVDKSLVQAARGAGGVRFRLSESVRLYALHHAPIAPSTASRHAAHYLELATRTAPELRTLAQQEAMLRLQAEQANLDVALDWLVREGTADDALTLASVLAPFWEDVGRRLEAREWLDRALARADDADRTVHARARVAASTLARTVDVQQARAHAEVAAELLHDDPERPLADAALGWALAYDGEGVDGATHLQSALEALDAQEQASADEGRTWERAMVLQGLALATAELPTTLTYAQSARQLFHASGDRRREANTLYTMASRALDAGVASDDVHGWLQESLTLAADADSTHDRAHAELGLARLGWSRGADDDVAALLARCLPTLRQLGDLRCTGRALLLSADLARHAGDLPGEARLLRACIEVAEPAADHKTLEAAAARQTPATADARPSA